MKLNALASSAPYCGIKTITDYNNAIDNGTTDNFEVSRSANPIKIPKDHFHAVPTTVSGYHTFGGLMLNENARVLDLESIRGRLRLLSTFLWGFFGVLYA